MLVEPKQKKPYSNSKKKKKTTPPVEAYNSQLHLAGCAMLIVHARAHMSFTE